MAIVLDGVEWVTTGEACRRLAPDVSFETLRNWYAPRDGGRPRVRRLLDVELRPVRIDRQYLVCWPDVVEAERETRTGDAGGRPRSEREM